MIFEGTQPTSARRLIWKSVWLVLVAGLLTYAGYRGYRNYSGYCFAQGRYLSDADFVRAAVRYNAHEISLGDRDNAVSAFVASHPECCQVDKTSHLTSGWFARVLGIYWIVVDIAFDARPDWAPKSKNRKYQTYVELNACGVRGNMFGEFIDDH